MAEVVDFVSIESNVAIKTKASELACDIDMLRSLKKTDIKTPDGDVGFWAMEQKAGQVNWQDVEFARAARPDPAVHLPAHFARRERRRFISAGGSRASAAKNFTARSCRITSKATTATFKEISQIGEELKLLAPALKDTKVVADVCILYSHDNEWALQPADAAEQIFQPARTHPAHLQRAARPQHLRWILRARPKICRNTKSSSRRRCICLRAGEADRLKLYVQNGGTLVGTFNTGLVNQHHIAPDTGLPERPDRFVRAGSFGIRSHSARRRKSSHVQRRVPDQPYAPGQTLVRHHRAEGLPDSGDLCEGFLCRPPGHDDEHLRPRQGHLHRHP